MTTSHCAITLFLDFDGVTHPEPTVQSIVFSCLPRIESVLREHSQVEIVISSSWRETFQLFQLQDNFARDIFKRVIDVTPLLLRPSSLWRPPASVRHARQAEIEMWLQANRQWDHPWIAIDDVAHWFEPECRNLLLTDGKAGFTDEDAARLKAMIKERT